MMKVSKKEKCCGCGACKEICPVSAIYMIEDKDGFVYPEIDEEKCISCGLCEKKCAFSHFKKSLAAYEKGYIAKFKNEKARLNSRSGGVFVALSDWVLKNDGVIYGCIIDDNFNVKHIRTDNKEIRNLMCKSKYVQSDITSTFSLIKKDLEAEKYVLYSGTGCQLDAIIKYLEYKKIDMSKLITMDIVCHGCPSPKIFREYIDFLEKKYKGKIKDFEFRDKIPMGWDSHIESFKVNGKKHYETIYTNLFHSHCMLRPSCYNCSYTSIRRNTDITIADAWGINKNNNDFNDDKGVSFLIFHSDKQDFILNVLKESCDIREVNFEDFLQRNMKESTSVNLNDKKKFWNLYHEKGINGLIRVYKMPLKKRLKIFLKFNYKIIKK